MNIDRFRIISNQFRVGSLLHPRVSKRLHRFAGKAAIISGLLSIVIVFGFPILIIFMTAFKTQKDAYSARLLFVPTLQNFVTIFSPPYDVKPFLFNTIFVALGTVCIAVPFATLTAYAFSRYEFRFKDTIMILLIATQFIAPVVVVLPFFVLFHKFGLLNTRIGLIILYLSFSLPFAVWMIKGFIDTIPKDIEEAALVDGCNPLQVIRYITVPLISPGIITASIFIFISSWNEFLFALVTTSSRKTITVAMMIFASQLEGVQWQTMAAVATLIMVPIFVLSFTIRRHFIQGIMMGAVK